MKELKEMSTKDLLGLQDDIKKALLAKTTERPQIKESIDWSSLIALAEDIMNGFATGEYCEDNDNPQFVYEEALKTIYGDNVFKWINVECA